MTTNFKAAAVRFGKVGLLYAAPLGTTEPADAVSAWPTGWGTLGYTDTGSAFHYTLSKANVEVAEELDIFARVTTGRDASVDVSLAEITYRNLTLALNGGLFTLPATGKSDASAWSFEPPDLGAEVSIMIGWDANPTVASNDLRFIFRQVSQGGAVTLENRKGNTKQVISCTFQLEKPATGAKLMKIMGAAVLNPVP